MLIAAAPAAEVVEPSQSQAASFPAVAQGGLSDAKRKAEAAGTDAGRSHVQGDDNANKRRKDGKGGAVAPPPPAA